MVCGVRCDGAAYDAFWQQLRELGRVDGRNLVTDIRGADGQYARLPAMLSDVLAARPDLIVAAGPQPVRAAKDATATLPIVMMFVADPVLIGLVPSLTRPGGNLTGVTTLPAGDFPGKQLELLKEMVPGASRVGVLWNSTNEIHRAIVPRIPASAQRLDLRLQLIDVRTPADIEPAFETAARERAQALLVVGDPLFHRPAGRLPELALRAGLPAIYLDTSVVAAGGLMAYAPDYVALARRAAVQADRILKGARPGEIPIEQPSTFSLGINLKTAKALGLTVPPRLLLQATETFE